MAPVSRLPAEVLGEIFSHLHIRTDDDIDNPQAYHPALLWIPEATHVCHAWREVALHNALLWQDIHVTASTSWAIEFERRSKQAPLRIFASNSVDMPHTNISVACDCTEQLVQASIERVQKIVLDCIPESSIHRILSGRSSPADEHVNFPILTHLVVATLEPFILTDDTLCAPLLESLLVVKSSFVDWKAFSLFQNLSYLEIDTDDDVHVADLDAIHKALCQMPNLRGLCLTPEISDIEPIVHPVVPYQPATLPRLRRIRIEVYDAIWLSSFLDCIAYGPERDLQIYTECYATSSVKRLFSHFPSIMQQAKESSIRSLRITTGTGHFSFAGWRCETDAASQKPPIDISIDFPMTLRPTSTYPFGIGMLLLGKSLRGVHLRCLTSLLLIVSNEPVPAETWARLFRSLPNLTSVAIKLGFRELCAALVNDIKVVPDSPPQSTTTNCTKMLFRALESVTVQEEKGPYSAEDIDYMRRCLRRRLDLKVPLKRLRITFEQGMEDHGLDVVALKDLVTVECDVGIMSK